MLLVRFDGLFIKLIGIALEPCDATLTKLKNNLEGCDNLRRDELDGRGIGNSLDRCEDIEKTEI